MTGIALARILGGANLVMLSVMFLFRAFIYSRMYLAPDAPYGISDVIEMLLGWILIFLLAISGLVAAILIVKGPRTNRNAGISLALIGVAVLLLVEPLHSLACQLSASLTMGAK